MLKKELSIGQVAARSGLPISTLHFYERKRLIASQRNGANHRVYPRDVLRRIAIIKVAQSTGVPLAQIAKAFASLPKNSAPKAADWERLSTHWHDDLSERIAKLTALRDKMTVCIGCGCLSLSRCPLVNDEDHLAEKGAGAHLL